MSSCRNLIQQNVFMPEPNPTKCLHAGNCPKSASTVPEFQPAGTSGMLVCWLLACLLNNPAGVSLGRICSNNFKCYHTEIKAVSVSPSHGILPPDRPVPALTPQRQAPGKAATGVPILKPPVRLDPGNNPHGASGNRSPDLPLSRGGRLKH